MRGAMVIVGFVLLGLMAFFVYRDIETREMLAQLARPKPAPTPAPRPEAKALDQRTRVLFYVHDSGLTERGAEKLAAILRPRGFDIHIAKHPSPKRADAVFIGALVKAEDAQLVLTSLPYEIEYIFRLDYPREHGGDPEGRAIGVGYVSSHLAQLDDPRVKPVRLSRQQLASLLQPKLSNAEFQIRLRKIAGP